MIAFIEKHFEALLVGFGALVLALATVAFVQEHDARILAEQTVHQSQDRVAVLEKDKQDVQAAGDMQIAKLQKQAQTVKTPAQAIQAIPALSDVPLNARPVPGVPTAVTVDAVPLFNELNSCKQDAVNLNTCSLQLGDEQKIEAEKDIQITALKKKPGFFKRLEHEAEVLAIGVAIGYAAHR